MLNILKRIFIGVTVGLLIFLIKDKCFAATTVSSYSGRIGYYDASCMTFPNNNNIVCVPIDENVHMTNFTNFGTAISEPNTNEGIGASMIFFGVRLSTSSDSSTNFVPGYTYSLSFSLSENSSKISYWADSFSFAYAYRYDNGYVPNGVLVTSATLVNNDSGVVGKINFQVTTSTQYVYFTFDSNNGNFPWYNYSFTFNQGKLDMSTSAEIQAIMDQTLAVVQSITRVITNINSASSQQHTDAQSIISAIQNIGSAFTGTNDTPGSVSSAPDPYTSSGLSQVEGQVNWGVSSSAFDVDTTDFDTPISFIWLQITNFIGLDPKIYSLLLACIILSFIALVVGRT